MKIDASKLEQALAEVLTKDTPIKTYVKDFAKSKAPQFKGKSKEKKHQMAVAAYLSKQDENISEDKGRDMAREFISKMRDAMRSLSDDELDTFRKDIAQALDLNVNELINEDEGTLNKIADMLDRKFPDLRFNVNAMLDRIDVYGSQQDLYDFGTELSGEKIFDYEVWHTDDDDRGEIVRIVKSDSIMRGGVKEEQTMQFNPNLRMATYAGRPVVVNTMGTEDMTKWTATFLNTGKKVDFADVAANIKLNEEPKKKADRCLRIARRKIPQSSAYRSGLIVKCRKGMIWKKEK